MQIESPHKSKSGLVRIWRAFRYSLEGFAAAIRHEHAFRQELMLFVLMLPFALLMQFTAIERALLIASLMLVLIVELLNSAVEAVVDRVSMDDHDLSKRAKDIGSAAVFLSLVLTGVVWLLIAGPAVMRWF
jgi:diacylglycerol kinase (ATP)